MGVYTRLYAPIFNYIRMSQTEKEVRKYNRGNDEVELDAWLQAVSSGYDEFEKSLIGRAYRDSKGKMIKIKQEDIEGLRNAYNNMFKRLNSGDNSITYNYENAKRGFNDSTGEIKGDIVYNGLIAKYFGDKLREMTAYKKPEVTPLIAPVDYNESALGNIFQKRAFGSGTVQSFIDKDVFDKSTKTRSNTERSKYTRGVLQSMLNDLQSNKNEFSKWTDEQKNQASINLTNLFTIFDNDNAITDNEYFDLERVLGLSNARQLYATGELTAPQQETVADSNGNVVRRGRTYADKIRAIQTRWGLPYTGQLAQPITIGKYNMSRLGSDAANKIGTALSNASAADLTGIIQDILGREGRNSLNTRFISNIFNGDNPFVGASEEDVRNFLLTNALNLLNGKPADHSGGLHNFGESNFGAYYIGGTQTDRGTGFVFDKNNRTISEMGIYNIPYWQTYINNWWDSLENSDDESDLNPTLTSIFKRKEGGTIRKFDGGGKTGILSFNPKGNNIYFTGNFSDYDNWHAHNIVLPWLNSKNNVDPNDWENVIINGLNSWNNAGGFDWYNATDDQRKHRMQSSGTQAHQQYVIDYLPGLNAEIAKHISSYSIPEKANTNDRFVNGVLKGTDTDFGIQTGNRRPSIHIKTAGQDLIDWDNFYKNLGYVGRYQYLDHWVPTKNKDKQGVTLFEQDVVPTPKTDTAPTQQPEVKPEETPEQEVKDSGSDVPETDTDPGKTKSGNNRFISTVPDLIPTAFDILGTGLSHWYNRKIERAAQPHLSLRDPLNLHKAVLGNEPLKQAYHRKEAEIKSAAYRNADADADRNAARMFEAQRIGSEIGLKGDLIDDEAIRKSKEEQFNLTKELAYFNKQNVYDVNKDRTAKFLDIKGQLRASRLKADHASIDRTIRAIGTRLATRAEEDRQYGIAANQHQNEKYNKSKYNEELSQIASLKNAWISANPGKSITSTSWFNTVAQREAELMDRLDNDNILSSGKIRGYNYLDLYKDNPYMKKDWSKIIV